MAKFNNFLSFVLKVCKKDIFVAVSFLLLIVELIGTTSILFASHQPFFAVVNLLVCIVFVLLYLAIYSIEKE